MRGDLLLKILEGIGQFGGNLENIFEAILTAGYGSSMRGIHRNFQKISQADENRELTQKELFLLQKRFNKMLSYLKQDDIIKTRERNGLKELIITPKGWRKLDNLRRQLSDYNLPIIDYPKVESEQFTIVLFDIPEKERQKRNWFREVLKSLGFQMLQKSAWGGKIKIPKELLDDLYRLKISGGIEIFTINKAGSLRKLF